MIFVIYINVKQIDQIVNKMFIYVKYFMQVFLN